MLFKAPSTICSLLTASLAFRTPTVKIATSDRNLFATARPAASSPELLMRRPLESRAKVRCRPKLVLASSAWAFTEPILLTTEKLAICFLHEIVYSQLPCRERFQQWSSHSISQTGLLIEFPLENFKKSLDGENEIGLMGAKAYGRWRYRVRHQRWGSEVSQWLCIVLQL